MFPVAGYTAVDNAGMFYIMGQTRSVAVRDVYLLLCHYAYGRKSTAWPGTATLAKQTGLTTRAVEQARSWLRRHGLIETDERSHYGTIFYRLRTLAVAKGTEPAFGTPPNQRSAKESQYKKQRPSPDSTTRLDNSGSPDHGGETREIPHAELFGASCWSPNDRRMIEQDRERYGDARAFEIWQAACTARGIRLHRIVEQSQLGGSRNE